MSNAQSGTGLGSGLLQKASVEVAFLKAGLLGFGGSGKTYTAAQLGMALASMLREQRGEDVPIAFFDTETGSDYIVRTIEERGFELFRIKSRAFSDLLTVMGEVEAAGVPLIIDSITHVWKELIQTYCAARRIKGKIPFHHWGPIKEEWQQFTDLYLNAPAHVIICGRAGWDYDMEEDEDGKKELIKTGVKMKAETEMGYEPSLLVEMQRIERSALTGSHKDRGWVHRAIVLKDRFDLINGEDFDFERNADGQYLVNGEVVENERGHVYAAFAPHIEALALGGEHRGVDTSRTSADLVGSPDRSRMKRKRMVEITLEEIKQAFVLGDCDSQSKDDKKRRAEIMQQVFKTTSWTAITDLPLEKLQVGLTAVRQELGVQERPLTEDEIELFVSVLDRGRRAGLVSAEEKERLTQAAIDGKWDEVRAAWSDLDTELMKARLKSPDFSDDFEAPALPFDDEDSEADSESKEPAAAGAD